LVMRAFDHHTNRIHCSPLGRMVVGLRSPLTA
jgi:hypothetical protein